MLRDIEKLDFLFFFLVQNNLYIFNHYSDYTGMQTWCERPHLSHHQPVSLSLSLSFQHHSKIAAALLLLCQ